MKKKARKTRIRRRKCRHCGELYRPDRRRLQVQKYCSQPECRKASQASSWHRWFAKPENRDYYKGEYQVDRVRTWRASHPEYWKKRPNLKDALPNVKVTQPTGHQGDTPELAMGALPKMILSEPALVVGLMAQLTGSALPKDIAETSHRLLVLGQDILGKVPGINPKGGRRDGKKTYSLSRATAPSSAHIQLD